MQTEKNNEADITKHCFVSNSEDINSWLKPNDIFIVDRELRDAVTFLEERGLKVHIQFFYPKAKNNTTSRKQTFPFCDKSLLSSIVGKWMRKTMGNVGQSHPKHTRSKY